MMQVILYDNNKLTTYNNWSLRYITASFVCNERTNSNPENTVGILSMAGKGYVAPNNIF